MARLGWQRFGSVAHDVGSFVAQALARRAPKRVTGLFFFNCAYPGIGARWVEPRHLGEVWYQYFQQQPCMKPGRQQGGFNWYAGVHDARRVVIEGRASPEPPIALPTRVLWGAHDPVLKVAWADRLQEHFSTLRFDVQADAGHFVHLERPDAVAAEFDSFLRIESDSNRTL